MPAMASSASWNTFNKHLHRGGRIDPGSAPIWRSASAVADYAPRRGAIAAGADPPCAHTRPPWPLRTPSCAACMAGLIPRFPAWVSLRALLRDASEQCPDFRLPVPAVPAKGTDGSQLPGLGPPRDGLRVNPEHGRDLCWGQQRLGLWRTCRHVDGLSSWTGTAILRFLLWMSLMVYSDHIAITSGDKSTTRSQRFPCEFSRRSLDCVTLRDSSDTQRRNGQIRKSHPPLRHLSFPVPLPLPAATWP